MKDLKYIIKRIIIGVGIVFCLSCLNGCKVKAYYQQVNNYRKVEKETIFNNNNIFLLKSFNGNSFYRNVKNNSIYFCTDFNDFCYEMYFDNDFSYENIGLIITRNSDNSSSTYYRSCAYLSSGALPKIFYNSSTSSGYPKWNNAYYNSDTYVFCPVIQTSSNYLSSGFSSFQPAKRSDESFLSPYSLDYTSSPFVNISSNIKWNWSNEHYVDNDNIINIGGIPDFVSFHAQPNLFQNVITSYNIRPEFSVFDNDTYKYEYSFDAKRWLGLNENKQLLKINNNTTIYVRILKRENDEYINGATLTISQIGTFFYDDLDYNVKITGEYRTDNYLNDNISSKSQSNIKEYQIYTDFYPNSSILKYQYQWVPNDSEFSEDKWVDISKLETNNNEFGDFTYVVSENGVFYARILDKDNNYLASATLTVDSIGKLALDNNQESVDNFLTRLGSKIDFGGPVGSLFSIPVNLLNSLYTSMSNSSSCSPFQLGSLLGTNMYLGCYNFKSILGEEVYNIIDIIFAFVLTLGVFKFILKLYNNFISMKEV